MLYTEVYEATDVLRMEHYEVVVNMAKGYNNGHFIEM